MRTQWIASWKERGVQGVSADKRLVLVMEDYDYAFRIEELVENKYEERGKIVIPHQSSDIMKLLQGFFHKAQTLKSKVFTAVDKAPAPVLFDITMPIFKNGTVEALRFTSVNKDDGSGKIKRETVLAIYRYPSYDSFKEYNNKKVESGQLRPIPKDYIVAGIKLSNMPITNGSFVYNDCAVLDSIAHALDSAEAARIWHPVVRQLDKLGDEANAQKQAGGYSSSNNVDTSSQSSHNSSSDMSAPVTGSEPAPTLSEPDDEYPF
jgi:hypothetical protein